MAVRIQIRRDNSTNWSSANPVLALGELGYDTTNEKLKIGDGVTAWNSLLYIASTDWDDLLNTPTTLSGYGITDAVTKNYVDNLVQGLRALPSGEAFSDSNLDATYDNGDDGVGATLTANSNGAFPTIDDVTLSQFDGVIVNGQTNAAHNGSYRLTTVGDVGTPWVLTRCGFCDESDEQAGSFEFVTSGTTYGNTGWLLTVASTPVVMGTTELNWVQFSGAGAYTAGDGLDLAGTVFSVNVDDSTIEINSDTVRVKDSGITNAKLANPTITVTGDTGTSAIDLGDTLTISGTDPIDTTVSGDTLTLSIDDATTSSKGAASFNSANFTVSSGAVSSKDITLGSSTLTLGSTTTAIAGLTQLTIDNIDINGNTIISTNTDGDINLIPNANGNVGIGTATPSTKLDVNGNITATRLIGSADTLTTARNIALTGAVTGNADFDGSGNISISTTATSDPTLTLDGDASGSATFTNLGNATLTVTVADDSHNHIIGNVDGLQTALDGKAATTTTISAGGGLTGGGSLASNRTISHSDTSSQSSVNNSNGTVIQDVTLDTYGHVTALGSVNLDGRYYTESEIDTKLTNGTVTTIANQWSNVAGNMTGFVNDGGGNLGIRFNATPGGTNTLVEDGIAYELEVGNDSSTGNFTIFRGSTSGGLAGQSISWTEAFRIDGGADTVRAFGNVILTTADEGSGNGLDADTLDGLQASQFLRSDANDIMGGTLTISNSVPILQFQDTDSGNSLGRVYFNNNSTVIEAQDSDGTGDGNIYIRGWGNATASLVQFKATTTNATNNLNVDGIITCSTYNNDSAPTRDKLRVWSTSDFAIGMDNAYTFGGLGDYAMTFQMSNTNARGFWWGDNAHSKAQGAMSLTTNGYLTVASGMKVGYGESHTSSPSAGLQVNGDIVANNVNLSGDINIDGDHIFFNGLQATSGDYLFYQTLNGLTYYENGSAKWRLTGSGDNYINGGNLGIGKTNPGVELDVVGTIRSEDIIIYDETPILYFQDSDTSNYGRVYYTNGTLVLQAQDSSGSGDDGDIRLSGYAGSDARLVYIDSGEVFFRSSNSEYLSATKDRVEIFGAPQDGAPPGNGRYVVVSTDNTTNARGLAIDSDDGVNDYAFQVYGATAGGAGQKCVIYGDGDIQNTNNNYGSLSDIRYKQDIVDANSQWDDIKAVQLKNYRLKNDVERYGDQAITQLGVIAQDLLDSGMSGLVDYNEDQDRYSVKYSVLCLKALGALQQAMEKIEILEAKVAALEQK